MEEQKKDPTMRLFFKKPMRSDASVEFENWKSVADWLAVEIHRLGAFMHVQNLITWISNEKEMNKLSDYIMRYHADDIRLNESAVDVAIRLLKEKKDE